MRGEAAACGCGSASIDKLGISARTLHFPLGSHCPSRRISIVEFRYPIQDFIAFGTIPVRATSEEHALTIHPEKIGAETWKVGIDAQKPPPDRRPTLLMKLQVDASSARTYELRSVGVSEARKLVAKRLPIEHQSSGFLKAWVEWHSLTPNVKMTGPPTRAAKPPPAVVGELASL
jgi:hypothetical protein